MSDKIILSACLSLLLLAGPVAAQTASTDDLELAEKEGRYGYMRGDTWVIKPYLTYASPVKDGFAVIAEDKNCGVIDANGKQVIPCRYERILPVSQGLFAVRMFGKWGFLDTRGVMVIPFKYRSAHAFSDGLAAVSYNGKEGYIDMRGQWYSSKSEYTGVKSDYSPSMSASAASPAASAKPKADAKPRVYPADELILTEGRLGKFGYKHGDEWAIKAQYDFAYPFSEGVAVVNVNGKFGVINAGGEEIVACRFAKILPASSGLIAVKAGNRWGFLDLQGKQVVPFKYSDAESFANGLAAVTLNDRKGFIDVNDQWYNSEREYGNQNSTYLASTSTRTTPAAGYTASPVAEPARPKAAPAATTTPAAPKKTSVRTFVITNLVPVKEGQKYGYKKDGEWVIQPKYDFADAFSEGVAVVSLNGKFGLVNTLGEQLVPFKYEKILSASEDLVAVRLNGKWGFINLSGETAVMFKYDDVRSFSEGYAAVMMNKRWGFIDAQGNQVISFKYTSVQPFSHGLASVNNNGRYGYINSTDQWFASKTDYIEPFTAYASRYVTPRVEEWQKKGKYEKTADWQRRVSNESRTQKIQELQKEAQRLYITEYSQGITLTQHIVDYDADNEVFRLQDDRFGDLLVPVDIDHASDFETNFYKLKRSVRYFVQDDGLALAELDFAMDDGKKYAYNNAASVDFFATNIDYNFAPIEIAPIVDEAASRGNQRINYASLTAGVADVDKDVPRAKESNANTFAVIIANELYKNESQVAYARADGESFKNYCCETLGLPEENIRLICDASLNDMRSGLSWLRKIGSAYGSDAKAIVYYAGHGMPDENMKTSYLLPVDGSATDTESGYELGRFYSQLGELPMSSVTVFVDACFSGAKRDGDMLLAARSVVIKSPIIAPKSGNVVVFSASQGDEVALPYPKMGHGLFTYFLLKRLQDSKGNTTLGELADYLAKNVNREAVVSNSKEQTPTVTFSPMASGSWGKMHLR